MFFGSLLGFTVALRGPVIDLSAFAFMYDLILLNFFTVHSKNLSTEYPRNIPETY